MLILLIFCFKRIHFKRYGGPPKDDDTARWARFRRCPPHGIACVAKVLLLIGFFPAKAGGQRDGNAGARAFP